MELVGTLPEERHMWLKDLLRSGVYEITFTKVDGSERVMPCTLQESQLPVRTFDKQSKPGKAETLSVWCTDRGEWRSFRVMNVVSVKPL